MTPAIYTFSGRRLNPLSVRPEDLDITDLAHHLATLNRFTGACREPLSIAQHSVWAARLVEQAWYRGECDGPRYPYPPHRPYCRETVVLQALLHDAAEAFLNDVSKWLKAAPEFAAYRLAERKLQRTIYAWAGCPLEETPALKQADNLLVRYEMLRLLPPGCTVGHANPEQERDYPPLTEAELELFAAWELWDWKRAKAEFLATYASLPIPAAALSRRGKDDE